MNKLRPLIILTYLILFSISGYAQTLANLKPETPSESKPRNSSQAQLYVPSNNVEPTKICLCCSTKRQEPILWVIKTKKKEYVLSETIDIGNNLNPLYISKLEIYKDSTSLSKYGQAAKNGVIIVSIAKEHEKEVFKRMKRYLTTL